TAGASAGSAQFAAVAHPTWTTSAGSKRRGCPVCTGGIVASNRTTGPCTGPVLAFVRREGGWHDSQARIRQVPPVLATEGPANGQASQPRHVPDARRGAEARTRGSVLQAPRLNPAEGTVGRAGGEARSIVQACPFRRRVDDLPRISRSIVRTRPAAPVSGR